MVYPWPMQLANDDRNSRQVAIWRELCAKNCNEFINSFPALFAEKDAHPDWYERLFNPGDVHFSAGGTRSCFARLRSAFFESLTSGIIFRLSKAPL